MDINSYRVMTRIVKNPKRLGIKRTQVLGCDGYCGIACTGHSWSKPCNKPDYENCDECICNHCDSCKCVRYNCDACGCTPCHECENDPCLGDACKTKCHYENCVLPLEE